MNRTEIFYYLFVFCAGAAAGFCAGIHAIVEGRDPSLLALLSSTLYGGLAGVGTVAVYAGSDGPSNPWPPIGLAIFLGLTGIKSIELLKWAGGRLGLALTINGHGPTPDEISNDHNEQSTRRGSPNRGGEEGTPTPGSD